MNAVALPTTVADLIAEYDDKVSAAYEAVKNFETAYNRLQMAATVQGTYAEKVGDRPFVQAETVRRNLLKSGWQAVYNRLQIGQIATAKDRQRFEREMTSPPPLTFENAKATFGDYLMRPRYHILRGIAEVFCSLDPAYKSHSKVKIGVKGLPKRIVVNHVGGYGSYGLNKVKDVLNALSAYRALPLIENEEMRVLDSLYSYINPVAGEVEIRGVTIRKFLNGNAHVIFDANNLLAINLAMAEFYGDVLPDVEDDDVAPRASTAVSKDLQYYWSPDAVINAALEFAGVHEPAYYRGGPVPNRRVLEPSCGDGRIMDALRKRGCHSMGVEYHEGRANQARSKGHGVVTANFLELEPVADFDFVIMNPPFYGRHYVKHVRHALKFLKPGGVLVSILPATAHYDHKELDGTWEDLPVGSFSESGTNVPTGLLRIRT